MPIATPIKGVNDLETLFPEIAKEWHPTKNGGFFPSDFKPGSKHIAWWKCSCGHEWSVAIYSRTKSKSGCPICSNLMVLKGYNDLATTNPSLAAEWHPTKNGDLKPTDVTGGSMKYAWWKCKNGHEWRALIRNRNRGYGCPKCKSYTQTSFPEQCIFYYLKKVFPDAINRYSDMFDDLMEVDVYIPSLRVAIEYDGRNWHTGKGAIKREKKKYEICKSKNVWLCRIRENQLDSSDDCDYEIRLDQRATRNILDETISKLGQKLGVEISCDTKKDAILIQETYRRELESQSLLATKPEIAAEWHPTKNGDLKPSMFRQFSAAKVWWMCSLGHEWKATIANRGKGYGCPYCGGKEILKGFNDLQTKFPEIAAEWHPTKNGDLKPDNVFSGSSKKVWWLCSNGHEYESKIDGRTDGRGCPYCAGRRLLVGFNDLATTNPQLASEWHPTKNGILTPSDVFEGGRQIVWWKCKSGHEWKAQISSRAKGGCPYCGGKKINIGFNDLATTHPDIAIEWHPTKNGDLKPTAITAGSRAKVWWICPKGHAYQMIVSRRKLGYNCPYCSGHKVLAGYNDLATINPQLASEWNVELNEITPLDVTAGSAKKVWWTCQKGHNYQMEISQRNLGHGCPYCSNHKLLVGYNDLASLNPCLASEWHPDKNEDLKPTDVMSCSDRIVWWRCPQGHEWQASIAHRKYNPNCPECRKKKE